VTSLTDLGKKIISESAPAGSDVRDDPVFESLQDEIGKLSNPVTSSSLDWAQVATLGADLLGSKGKDILTAAYMTGGLLHTRGLDGLADGLQVMRDLLEMYWETLFPPLQRLRARRNAMDWLSDRIRSQAEETKWSELPPQEPELIAGLIASLKAIDAVLSEKDPEASSMRPILALIEGIPVKAVIEEAADSADSGNAVPRPAASNAGAGAATGTAEAQLPLDSAENIEQACESALGRLSDIAAAQGEADATRALAYRLNRIAQWGALEAPPAVRNGSSVIPAPLQPVIDVLHKLVAAQADADILRFTEAQLQMQPFWLDLNYAAVQAMQRAGAAYDAARAEVSGETARLIARMPELLEMAFANAMPFADESTRQWLGSLGGAEGGSGGNNAAPQNEAIQATLSKARTLAVDDDLNGAAACVQQLIARTAAPADRLQLRIQLCAMLFGQRPAANLQAFARAIVADIDRYRLDEWDAALALSGLQTAYRVLERDDDNRTEADALLSRMVALDAAAAVKLVT
jgi:type VI secretion system protein VasJ